MEQQDTDNKEQKTVQDTVPGAAKPNKHRFKLNRLPRLNKWFAAAAGLILLTVGSSAIGGYVALKLRGKSLSSVEVGRQVISEESSAIIDVVNKIGPSVVSVTAERNVVSIFGSRTQVQQSSGTGIIIKSDGLIITNKHVIPESAQNITVITADGKQYSDAQVIARDPINDLAYIKIKAENLVAAELGDSDQVKVGQKVVAIGNALGEFENTVTAGIISGIGRPVTAQDESGESAESLQDLFQTDAAINPGNSGGPLANLDGKIIGINTAVAGNAENIGFAIPINQAKAGIASIEQSGSLKKPYLGVRYQTITKEVAKANNLPVENGALINGSEGEPAVIANSPAAKAGLRTGDIILKVDDKEINSQQSLVTLIGQYRVGDTLLLHVLRGDQRLDIKVTLEELSG